MGDEPNTAATLQKLKNATDYIWRWIVGCFASLIPCWAVRFSTLKPCLMLMPEKRSQVGDFKALHFIVDHTTGVRTRPDNINIGL